MPRKPTETVQVNLRMKEATRRRLEQAAKKHDVSLNAEMMRRLEDSFDQESQRSLDEVTQKLEAVLIKAQSLTVPTPDIGTPALTQNPAGNQSKEKQK